MIRIIDRAKALARRLGPLTSALITIRDIAFSQPKVDLSHSAGVTWRVQRIDPASGEVRLESYDRGGVYDTRINAEGLSYPDQVPGNYYADAYAAYVFAWFYRRSGDQHWLEACRNALSFFIRVYPSYLPAGIVWHHSDFKNPAFLETVEALLAPAGLLDEDELHDYRMLAARLQEDAYSPTNVFALRFYWYAARTGFGLGRDHEAMSRCLDRLRIDQTREGLFHDNIAAYPDAHDLTYHQYTLACLAQGLVWDERNVVRDLFLKGVHFSLALTTPDGEIAYVGRGANNIYHMASAILAFEVAASLTRNNPQDAGGFRRAARLLLERLERYQMPDGSLPTAMNKLADQRVGWNHCATPYNALSAAMLLKASQLAPINLPETPLPMDRPGYLEVMDDSGYAAVRTEGLYAVVFSGCAPSYAWSEGAHRTGVAGLAQLGIPGHGPLLPILDHPTSPGASPITDLPVINGEFPYGRGSLERVDAPCPAILYRRAYGRCRLARLYLFTDRTVLVVTRIRPDVPGRHLDVRGLVALPVSRDRDWHLRWGPGRRIDALGPHGVVTTTIMDVGPLPAGRPRIGRISTNPRGMACRVDLANALSASAPSTLWACHRIDVTLEKVDRERIAGKVMCRWAGDRLEVTIGDLRTVICLDQGLKWMCAED